MRQSNLKVYREDLVVSLSTATERLLEKHLEAHGLHSVGGLALTKILIRLTFVHCIKRPLEFLFRQVASADDMKQSLFIDESGLTVSHVFLLAGDSVHDAAEHDVVAKVRPLFVFV